MKGPEGKKLDKIKETDPIEVASYDKPRWLHEVQFLLFPGNPAGRFVFLSDSSLT